jgi:hypothetical protein
LRFEAPDSVEAQQLAYFTGQSALDVAIDKAVVVSGDPERVAAAAGRSKVGIADDARAAAQSLFTDWVIEAERIGFGADEALLRAALDDPLGRGYLGLWLESDRLGRFYYRMDPSEIEAVGMGAYELFQDDDFRTERSKKRRKQAERNKRKLEKKLGRPVVDWIDEAPAEEDVCGVAVDDDIENDDAFEWIGPWVSTRSPDAHPQDEPPGVEPESYEIRMTLTGDDLDARGEAVLRLRPVTIGQSAITLSLDGSLEVCEIFYEDDEPVTFRRLGRRVVVSLPEPTAEDEPFELTVRYAGQPIEHKGGRRLQKDTLRWYPHAGQRDRATYDVKLRWPEGLSVLASGEAVEQGTEDGMQFTHQVLDVPTMGVSFEIGNFDVVRDEVGHMELVVAFPADGLQVEEETRQEIVDAVKASILLFESKLGVLPIEHMKVVLVRRGFAQGLLGFVTLAEGAAHTVSITGQRDRLELIAHEISHQWWGHMVGWDNYRDQWLSEALATFSSAQFMENISADVSAYRRERSELWRRTLMASTFDGRPVASSGPVVLGWRLRGHAPGAYQSIVYDKGALVFSTLAQRLGPTETWEMLGTLAKAVNNRVIRTSTFFRALEQMSGQGLQGFVDQYVRGVGMPAVFYDYRFGRGADGGWIAEGRVRQLPAPQFRFVLERTDNGWDVVRRTKGDSEVPDWNTVIPFYAEVASDDAEAPPVANAGKVTVRGESSTFRIELAGKPAGFVLDPLGQILADIHAEDFEPKRYLCELGEHLVRLGRHDDGLDALDEALEADVSTRETAEIDPGSRAARELNARIRLARARVYLDLGDAAEARAELDRVEELLDRNARYYAGERAILRARLQLRNGAATAALEILNTYLDEYAPRLSTPRDLRHSAEPLSEVRISRGEALGLLATASHLVGERDSALLWRVATVKGVDLGALRR